jgi:hypothetical protein
MLDFSVKRDTRNLLGFTHKEVEDQMCGNSSHDHGYIVTNNLGRSVLDWMRENKHQTVRVYEDH